MRISRVFFDIDMRQSFEGLSKVIRQSKINPETLSKDSFIVFMNRKATYFKVLCGKDYLTAYSNGRRRIPLDAIQYLPETFGGNKFILSQAIEKSIKVKLKIE